MKSNGLKLKASSLLALPLLLALAFGFHFVFMSEASLLEYINNFFGILLGGGKSVWEKILVASLLVGVGNALFVPVNILLVATTIFLPGWPAFVACMTGALIAAALGYLYGLFVDVSFIINRLGRQKYDIIVSEISKDGLKSVVVLCFAPIAPNLLTNILAGLCRIHLWKLMLGTIIGFLPGVAILTLLGSKIRQMLENPGAQTGIWIIALIALFALSYKISKRIQERLAEKEEMDEP